MKTDEALRRLLSDAWQVGYARRDGVWRSQGVCDTLGVDVVVPDTHYFRHPSGVKNSGAVAYDIVTIPTGGTVEYDRTPDGEFRKQIAIRNTQEAAYSPEYVEGITDPVEAERVWLKARDMFLLSETQTDFQQDLAQCWALFREEDVIRHIDRIFGWSGWSPEFVRRILNCSFEVADVDSESVIPWNIGDVCRVNIPLVTNSGDYSGIITAVQFRPETYSCVVGMRVAEVQPTPDRIVESGIGAAGRYIETGISTDPNIIEIGVV
jgi:hypothetical protein